MSGKANLTPAQLLAGNQRHLVHGSYSLVQLGPRAAELSDEIAELVPAGDTCDRFAIGVLSLALARLERAAAALDENPRPRDLARLEQDARGWANSAMRAMDSLGLTPLSRSRLGLNIVRTREIVDRPATDLSRLGEKDLASLRVLFSKADGEDAA
jgi:hypothetical protein